MTSGAPRGQDAGYDVKPCPEDCAYAAGLFDGEGCVTISINQRDTPPTYALAVFVTMTDSISLAWLAKTFGGGMSDFKQYRPNRPHERPMCRWRMHGWRAYDFLQFILPYLQVKKAQAIAAMEFQRLKIHGYGTGRHYPKRPIEVQQMEAAYYYEVKRLKTIRLEEVA